MKETYSPSKAQLLPCRAAAAGAGAHGCRGKESGQTWLEVSSIHKHPLTEGLGCPATARVLFKLLLQHLLSPCLQSNRTCFEDKQVFLLGAGETGHFYSPFGCFCSVGRVRGREEAAGGSTGGGCPGAPFSPHSGVQILHTPRVCRLFSWEAQGLAG